MAKNVRRLPLAIAVFLLPLLGLTYKKKSDRRNPMQFVKRT